MKHILKAEEAALLGLSIILNHMLIPYEWWWYWVLFLAPDISMIGYAINTRIGAIIYNFGHHKATALLCFALGILISSTA